MSAAENIRISVRNLVEFVLRTGDIDARFSAPERMQDGTRAHRRIQKAGGDAYQAEVALSDTFEYRGFAITLEGRADGVISAPPGHVTVDEIKSVTRPLEEIGEDYNPLHWAQAECYAFILAEHDGLDEVCVQLTYCEVEGDGVKCFRKTFRRDELTAFVRGLFDRYIVWAQYESGRVALRDEAVRALKFPFERFRPGQRPLAAAVYRAIAGGTLLFAQAPTGIGKTISTLFPAVKAIGEGKAQKIFYLTAKTITRQVAQEAFVRMSALGPAFKTVTLTAKDKICPHPGTQCSPDRCELAKGYYDRANGALFELLNHESLITREVVERWARKYSLCPFEFSLDISVWTDCIICDYNYVFDPVVYLRRYFQNAEGDYVFLVDEAHNLVDRAREMYSAEVCKSAFLAVKRDYKAKGIKISRAADEINRFFLSLRKKCGKDGRDFLVEREEEKELYVRLEKFIRQAEKWLLQNPGAQDTDSLLEQYFNALRFTKIENLYDERYVTFVRAEDKEVSLKLCCLDPSGLLAETFRKGKSAVLFSATLSPPGFYREVLGGGSEARLLRLPSPFCRDHLFLAVADGVSTLYKNRGRSCGTVSEMIAAMVSAKTGNYMAYFPSYKYMNDVYERFSALYPEVRTLKQEPGMSEGEREGFLAEFEAGPEQTLVGFCVMGGVFSEGIDLKGERLIGTAVIGVGLPQLNPEQDVIRDYYKEKNGMGFEYAYMYPGMNKVLQAAGRVIRSESDRGVVLLIDERFLRCDYRGLFPEHWSHYRRVRSPAELSGELSGFWNEGA